MCPLGTGEKRRYVFVKFFSYGGEPVATSDVRALIQSASFNGQPRSLALTVSQLLTL